MRTVANSVGIFFAPGDYPTPCQTPTVIAPFGV
jgi:hypothetical protein